MLCPSGFVKFIYISLLKRRRAVVLTKLKQPWCFSWIDDFATLCRSTHTLLTSCKTWFWRGCMSSGQMCLCHLSLQERWETVCVHRGCEKMQLKILLLHYWGWEANVALTFQSLRWPWSANHSHKMKTEPQKVKHNNKSQNTITNRKTVVFICSCIFPLWLWLALQGHCILHCGWRWVNHTPTCSWRTKPDCKPHLMERNGWRVWGFIDMHVVAFSQRWVWPIRGRPPWFGTKRLESLSTML